MGLSELVRVNHARLVDEICVVVAVVDDVGPGIVPVWSPNFPDALYWKATPREVIRIAEARKRKYPSHLTALRLPFCGVDTFGSLMFGQAVANAKSLPDCAGRLRASSGFEAVSPNGNAS
jgi:hypothetical protein